MGPVTDPRYEKFKDEAFDMPFREAERELERMETHTPGSGSGAKASVIKRTAFRDALNERESPGERTYHGQGPPDTPSLDEQVIFSK